MRVPLGHELKAERLRGVYPFGRLRAGPEELEGLAKTNCSMHTYGVVHFSHFRHFSSL
jgi:hypothetical protein